MVKKYFFLLFFILEVIPFGISQNLVTNPSFEERNPVKSDLTLVNDSFAKYGVTGWYNPTAGWNKPLSKKSGNLFGTPDYYFSGNKDDYTGWRTKLIDPHSGTAYAGLLLHWDGTELIQDYVANKLLEPMKAGEKYLFSMYIAIYYSDTFEFDELGIYYSDKIIQAETNLALIALTPQLRIPLSHAGVQWEKYSIQYTAVGGEQYFAIGYFKKSLSSKLTSQDGGRIRPYSYCFIDDLNIFPIKQKNIPVISSGKTLVKDNIHFKLGDSTLSSASYPVLDEIIAEMKKQPKLKVEINGHTDNTGTPTANQKLSEARARSVAAYFKSKGIVANRITTKGLGSSKPISSDQNKNRRVEFIFY
jgi:OmpA-OmpF porin, OOP family